MVGLTDFSTILTSQHDIGLRFYLKIQGIPHIWIDGPGFVGKAGTAWTAPTSKTSYAYTLIPHGLDVAAGIRDEGSIISRASGDSQPGQMTIRLQEDRAGTLHGLMARDKGSGNTANLTASFGYDDASPPSSMTVDATAGWPAGSPTSYLYFGRETLVYGSTTSTTFGSLVRDVFSIGDADAKYRHNDNIASAPRVVADYPRTWAGRYVQLFAVLVDLDGRAYGSAFGSDYEREIWRGIIQGNPTPRNDWQTYELRCDSIESILDTRVGREAIKGTLIRVPQGALANQIGQVIDPGGALGFVGEVPDDFLYSTTSPAFWLDGNTRYFDVSARAWTNEADYIAGDSPDIAKSWVGPDRLDLLSSSTTGKALSGHGLRYEFDTVVGASIYGTFANVQLTLGPGYVRLAKGTGYDVVKVTAYWEAPGSVGKLLGFEGSQEMEVNQYENGVHYHPTGDRLAAYIPASATVPAIPFFHAETSGIQPDQPSASGGFALLGEEVIQYGSITDLGAADPTLAGLYLLADVTRGMMGTPAVEHRITLNEDWTAGSDEIEITFGIGFVDASFMDVMMQLAVSTGSGHHGDWDELADKISVPLNPNHFDTDAIEAIAAGLHAGQAKIDLFMSKSHRLRELISGWLRPHGLYFAARTNADGDFLITVDRLVPALESAAATAVGAAVLDLSDPADWVDGHDHLINQIRILPRWDPVEEDNTDDEILITDFDSVAEFGVKNEIEWPLRGYRWALGIAYDNATSWAHRLFSRYARPYDLFRLHMSRAGLDLAPGDVVELTLPGAPNPTGSRGYTDRIAVVLRVDKRWHPPRESGESTGADVTIALEPELRQSTYSPAARVASYDAGVPSITLHANKYTVAGTDADHFEGGDVINIYEEGDWSTLDQRTIVSRAGNVLTLSATLTNAAPVSATDTIITSAPYDSAQSSQQTHAYLADTAATLGAGADGAFRFI